MDVWKVFKSCSNCNWGNKIEENPKTIPAQMLANKPDTAVII